MGLLGFFSLWGFRLDSRTPLGNLSLGCITSVNWDMHARLLNSMKMCVCACRRWNSGAHNFMHEALSSIPEPPITIRTSELRRCQTRSLISKTGVTKNGPQVVGQSTASAHLCEAHLLCFTQQHSEWRS